MKSALAPLLVLAFWVTPALAKTSPLAPAPQWSRLDRFQGTITRAEFQSLLDSVYAPGGASAKWITVTEDAAIIETSPGRPRYTLRFAKDSSSAKSPPVYWRPRASLPPALPGRPLNGIRITIDPGHLGGSWAKMEERWFRIGNSAPVTEGDMTLKVAKLVATRLRALGADVTLTRSKPGPVTGDRPDQLRKAAVASLADKQERATKEAVKKESERLFYRASEIRQRARLVNEKFKPDLVLCLHFNAEDWGNEQKPRLVQKNHLHLLVTGAWQAKELAYEDQRLDMLVKLLGRPFHEESSLSSAVATSMAKATGLPPYNYEGGTATRVSSNPYVWGRNLLANRLFDCPVIYVEPYVMNNKAVFARIQAGDYDGTRQVGGQPRQSIYREYADGIVAGLLSYYSKR